MEPVTVAALQLTSTEDVSGNLARCRELVDAAAAAGARLCGLPENYAYLGSDKDHKLAIAESTSDTASGPILTATREMARRAGVWLLAGGFPEPADRRDRIHNTSLLLAPDGKIVARYRKIHLFDVDVPGGARFRESETVAAGVEPVTAETPWGTLGLSICYDLRFSELYRELTARGARILAVPSAFTAQTGKDHWHVLLRARAIENQAFVFAPAQFGHHGGTRASYGHALCVDPWGAVVAECGDHEGFALARFDFDYQDRVRQKLPALSHRRL